MEPSWRKPAGIFALLLYLAVYAGLVGLAGVWLQALPTALKIIVYLLLGLVWVLPLKPLLLWMNTGRWTTGK